MQHGIGNESGSRAGLRYNHRLVRALFVELAHFFGFLKLMPARYWHRLVILILARASTRLGFSMTDSIVLPFRSVIAYATTRHPCGLRFLIEIEGRRVYSSFSTGSGVTTLFDVGASCGFVSLTRCQQNPNLQAVCFEPHPDTFLVLQRNVALNHLQDRVVAVNAAVGKQSGTLRLYQAEGSSMAAASPQTLTTDGLTEISVSVVSLDEYCEQHNRWAEAIKIDVEGFEEQVLLGAPKTLERAKHVVLEWHSEGLRDRCRSLLQSHGFDVTERGALLFCERRSIST